MSRIVATVVLVAALGLGLSLLAITALIASGDPLAHAVVTIDGDSVTLAQLHGSSVLLGLATLVVLFALVLVLPLAVVLPLVATALALVIAFAAVLGSMALALSPLILLGWLIWRLARPERPAPEVVR